jgi:hypothetical protein
MDIFLVFSKIYRVHLNIHTCTNKQTKQTNALLSIKRPTMSSIINKKSQYTIDSHNNFFIERTIQFFFKKSIKKKSHLVRNIVIMVVF